MQGILFPRSTFLVMTNAQLCRLLMNGIEPEYYFNTTRSYDEHEVSTLNRITYAYIAPLIIAFGLLYLPVYVQGLWATFSRSSP